jgi:hypothetical protein
MEKPILRRAKRIADRPIKGMLVSDQEKQFLTIAAEIVVQIILQELEREEEESLRSSKFPVPLVSK